MTEIAQNALGLIEAIKDLKAQVTSLTKERDELQFKFDQRGRIMEGTRDDFINLKSQLSNRDEEIEELKEKLEVPDWIYEPENWEQSYHLRHLKDVVEHYEVGEIAEIGTLIEGPKRFYISPDSEVFFTTKEEALASLQSKGEEE